MANLDYSDANTTARADAIDGFLKSIGVTVSINRLTSQREYFYPRGKSLVNITGPTHREHYSVTLLGNTEAESFNFFQGETFYDSKGKKAWYGEPYKSSSDKEIDKYMAKRMVSFIYCVLSESNMPEDYRDEYEFAVDMGYGPTAEERRKAHLVWLEIIEQRAKLRRIFSNSELEVLSAFVEGY